MLPYIDVSFEFLSEKLGTSKDETKMLTTFFLSYPFAAILKRMPDSKPWTKNVLIIAISLFYLVGIFDLWGGLQTLIINCTVMYLIAARVDSPFMPWIGFIFMMGYISFSHIHRQIVADPGIVDITGPQMVLVMKLTAFCWNVHDGRRKQDDLVDFQRESAIRQLPDLLDYAAYCLFFPSLFAGPTFDYIEYRRWLDTTMFDAPQGTDPARLPKVRGRRRIPRSGTPAAIKGATGVLWLVAFLVFDRWYNNALVLGSSYMSFGFFRRVWLLEMLGFTTRLKYYGVWSLTEGACILTGLGYRGVDAKTGKVSWDRLCNVYPWRIESAQNSRAYLENWNMGTNRWLRNYVYLRVTPKGKRPGFIASLMTFVSSAVWHGFYPGYYLTFVLAAFIQSVAKNFRRHVRPFVMSPDGKRPGKWKPAYDFLSYVVTQATFCFTTLPFCILGLRESLRVWGRVYFYAIVGVAVSIGFFASPGKAYLVKSLDTRNRRLEQRQQAQQEQQTGKVKDERQAEPILGLPDDLQHEFEGAVQEIRDEIELRRRRGSLVTVPTGEELKRAVKERVGKRL